MGKPRPMPDYRSLVEEVTHLRGHLEKLQEMNAELRESLRDVFEERIAEWNRANNAERENKKLRDLIAEL